MGIGVWEVIEAAKTKPFGFMPFFQRASPSVLGPSRYRGKRNLVFELYRRRP
jgi:hypothetical protein